jgi:hypothetical protein
MLDRLTKDLAHISVVERSPEFEGRLMVMYFSPLPTKTPVKKASKPKEEEDAKVEIKPVGEETVS